MSQSLAVPTGPSTMPATKLLGLMSALGVIGVLVERTLQQLETQLQSSELSREDGGELSMEERHQNLDRFQLVMLKPNQTLRFLSKTKV